MTTVSPQRSTDIELMAQLLRRAGFGATRDQIDGYLKQGYEATVQELLNPVHREHEDQDLLDRYFVASVEARTANHADPQWAWRLATNPNPLEEKIALFWHGLMAVGGVKLDHGMEMLAEIDLFRRFGLGRFEDLLLEISRNPGMMYWLDNQNSHIGAPNENYGRELLELFSMGIDEQGEGAYSEEDVKAAARAFTGWASAVTPPPFFLGPFPMEFRFDSDDHDDSEKTFLGQTGNWDGDDIVRIICEQRATARFVAMRLYDFFVSDTPNEKEIEGLADVFEENDGEIRTVLSAIFNSDHFKSAEVRYRKMKSPSDLVFGTTRLVDRFDVPELDSGMLANNTMFMGQHLLNPPSVEGWHEGEEWVDSGALIERINFASSEISRVDGRGVQRMLTRVRDSGNELDGGEFVEACLDAMGAIELSPRTRSILVDHADSYGIPWEADASDSTDRTIEMFQLIVSTPDYQYC